MVDEVPSDELRQRWWVRLRRSLGVPDLLSDGNARLLIARRLLHEHPMESVQPGQDIRIAEALIDSFIEVGAKGEMDSELLDDEEAGWLADGLNPRSAVCSPPLSRHDISSGPTADAGMAMVDDMILAIQRSVVDLPFEGRAGVYFIAATPR